MAGINQDEFDKIFMNWYYPVRNSIYYKSGDMQVSEDITQDAFLKIWEKRDTIDLKTVVPLLYRISGNLFLNSIEHSKVTLKFATDYSKEKFADSPEFELEVKEFDARLQKAIGGLDEKSRTVFLMNRIDDLTYLQIAESLGLTVKAIEKRMTKAMAYLKNQLNVKI